MASTDRSPDNGDKEAPGYKVVTAVAAMVSGLVAKKALALVWTKATGRKPPAKPEHPDVAAGEAIAWAAVSAVVMAVVRTVAQRKAAVTWTRANPPAVPADSAASEA